MACTATNLLGVTNGECPCPISPAPKPGQIPAFVNGKITWIDPAISPLTLNPDGSLTYVNEGGTSVTIPAAKLESNPDGTITYTNPAGVATVVGHKAGKLTDNGDGSFTYDPGDGSTPTIWKESVVSVVANPNGTATITNEKGVSTTVGSPALMPTNNAAPYSWNPATGALNIPKTGKLTDNGDGSLTFDPGDGTTPTVWKESVVSVVANPNGTATITNEKGVSTTIGSPALMPTNNAAPYSWNPATGALNIPKTGIFTDDGKGNYTFDPGDGTPPTVIKTCCPPDLFYLNSNPDGPQTVEVNGGFAPLTYAWTIYDTTTGATVTTSTATSPTFDWAALGGACGKLIRVTVTDANGNKSSAWQYAEAPSCAPAGAPDLALTKIAPASVVSGSNATIKLTVCNNGTASADGVEVVDTLPTGVTFVSATPTPTSVSATQIRWAVGTLAVGACQDREYVVTVTAASGNLSATANATTTSPETNTANNTATSTTAVTPAGQPDLALTKVAPASVQTGSNATIKLTVCNNGTASAAGVEVVDTLPAGVTFVSATPAATSVTATQIRWAIGALAAGACQDREYVVTVTAASGNLTATANATTTSPETNTANNSATSTTAVTPAANCVSSGTIPSTAAAPYAAGSCTAQPSLAALETCLEAAGFTVTLTPGATTPVPHQSTWTDITVVQNDPFATFQDVEGNMEVTLTPTAPTFLWGTDSRAGTFQHITTHTPGAANVSTDMVIAYAVKNISANAITPTVVLDGNSGVSEFNIQNLTLTYDSSKWDAVVSESELSPGVPVGTVLASGTTYPVTFGGVGNAATPFKIEFTPKPGMTMAPGEVLNIGWLQNYFGTITRETNGISISYVEHLPGDTAISISGPTAVPTVTANGSTINLTTNC